jgi:hypothetical protein
MLGVTYPICYGAGNRFRVDIVRHQMYRITDGDLGMAVTLPASTSDSLLSYIDAVIDLPGMSADESGQAIDKVVIAWFAIHRIPLPEEIERESLISAWPFRGKVPN